MQSSQVHIIAFGEGGIDAVAAACRISTSEGTALDAFQKSGQREKDLKLIGKVLSSGHNTVTEHAYFTLAFNNVSVLCEQLIIEHRLAAYTVKSRRYVDFSGAGFVIPEGLGEKEAAYRANMEGLFSAYTRLLEMDIPREDARFVLPYCFRSNFIMSCNARELMHMVSSMTAGRLSAYDEMRRLGEMLKNEIDQRFPGLCDRPETQDAPALPGVSNIPDPAAARQQAELLHAPENADALLHAALCASGRGEVSLKQLVRSARPRELELLNYVFKVSDVSLACVTHFTRHRMQSLIVPSPVKALEKNAYVLPQSIKQNNEALQIYLDAFHQNTQAARAFMDIPQALSYFALAGNTVDLLFGMNARELRHFLRLRTCARAQWEILSAAREMLALLTEEDRALFKYYGPSCAVLGHCPEGRLSCGKPQKMRED